MLGHVRVAGRTREEVARAALIAGEAVLVVPLGPDERPEDWPDRLPLQRGEPPQGALAQILRHCPSGVTQAVRGEGGIAGLVHVPDASGGAAGRLAAFARQLATVLDNQVTVERRADDDGLRELARTSELLRALEALDASVGAAGDLADMLAAIGRAVGADVALTATAVGDGGARAPVAMPGGTVRWLVADAPLVDDGRELLERAAELLSVRLARAEQVRAVRHRHAAAGVGDLLAGHHARAVAGARALGVELVPPVGVAVVLDDDVRDAIADALPAARAAPLWAGVVVVAAQGEHGAVRCRLQALGSRVGAAVATQLDDLGAAVAAARHDAHAAPRSQVADVSVDRDVAAFAEALLRPALEHDRQRGSDLVGTLRAYLVASGNVTESARRLDVHVNTLRHRLARIAELGIDLADPATRLGLELSLRLHADRLSGSPEPPGARSSDSSLAALAGRT